MLQSGLEIRLLLVAQASRLLSAGEAWPRLVTRVPEGGAIKRVLIVYGSAHDEEGSYLQAL